MGVPAPVLQAVTAAAQAPSWSLWLTVSGLLHLAAFVLVLTHCLCSRREPTSALLWIFLTWSFPVIGAFLYVTVGVDRVARKGFAKELRNQELLVHRQAREDESLPLAYWQHVHANRGGTPGTASGREIDRGLAAILPEYPLLGGNRIRTLVTGEEAYPAMLAAIARAGHHIHCQAYILGHDRVGRQFMDALAERARAGVRVRVLYDRFGSTRALFTGFFRRYRHVPNLAVAGWTQAKPLKRQFQINLRNHRKILVVDGAAAFTGGMNIHAGNIDRPGRPAIRDLHFEVAGPIVQELQYSFMCDWYFMTGESPDELLQAAYFPLVENAGSALLRLVNSGPSSQMERLTDAVFMATAAARERIVAMTPYFVPPTDLLRALRTAALRGIDVCLILPKVNNHVYTALACRALYDELLSAGVRIFERRPPFAHAKALLVDDAFALVGSANLDVRSLRLNYETNLAVYDRGFCVSLRAQLDRELAESDRVTPEAWARRPAWHHVLENFSRLMTPVL
jgi:cardiolipin synthase